MPLLVVICTMPRCAMLCFNAGSTGVPKLLAAQGLAPSVPPWLQSRGRARMENSELVMMVQREEPADMQVGPATSSA